MSAIGPFTGDTIDTALVRAASSLEVLTPALGIVADEVDTVVVDVPRQSRRIPADPRLAAIADQLAESILATLEAHGYAIVREADTQGYDEARQREFARECGRNAVGIAAMEGVL